MDERRLRTVLVLVAGLIAAVAVFGLGRLSVDTATPAPHGAGDYFDGLRVGEAQGRELGRAQQAGAELPAGDKHVAHDAFRSGYAAGANDVFAGYDGGWTYHRPWLISLDPGGARIDYRIHGRTPLEPGVAYFLCANGRTVCHARR